MGIRKMFKKENAVTLGEKTVEIEKVTPRDFKKLFGVLDTLPNLIINVARAPEGQEMEYLLTAMDIGLDEIVSVVSVLTDIDEDYLKDHCGMDELIEYFAKMVDFNNLEKLSKNVKSLLPRSKEETEQPKQ